MSGRILLVTGGSSDVGAALIRRVAEEYDKIVLHYHRSFAAAQNLEAEYPGKIVPIQADFSSHEETKNFIACVSAQGLVPNHFVHLSSSGSGSVNVRFGKTSWESFEQELNITFRSAVMCCQAFVPQMAKAGNGKVVVMLSAQTVWEPHKSYSTAYICVKHALLGLVKALSAEYAGKGVSVNGVSPSMIDTKFLCVPELVKEVNAASSPIGRLLAVDDVVPAIAFLLSSGADTITGQNIAVTAGC